MGLCLCTKTSTNDPFEEFYPLKVTNMTFSDFKVLVENEYRNPNMYFLFTGRKITGVQPSNKIHRKFLHEMIQESIDLKNYENVEFLLCVGVTVLDGTTKFINTDDSTEVYASFYRHNVRSLIQ